LQERKKWAVEKEPKLKVETIIIIREENTPSLRWKIGRVTLVNLGVDDVIRSAVMKTSAGE